MPVIVGVGASAGGLEAFAQLLRALPIDTGLGFVLVQHLAPTHPSALAEILSRATPLPVTEVLDELLVQPNHVYVIPPGQNMTIGQGKLRLLPREARGQQRPIDIFFESLAEDQGTRAMGVVLSGSATDGTLGLEAIKAAGGITFAQDDTAQHPSMPRSAVAAGCVDFVLTPDAIAREIARIAQHPYTEPRTREEDEATQTSNVARIVRLLQQMTGVDFSHYKTRTLERRIARRVLLQHQESLAAYVRFLEQTPAEASALHHDLLISVTSFFRDPEAFEALKSTVFPQLLEGRSPDDPLRIWVLGCSSGEEAYSLTIALTEAAERAGLPVAVQVFGTDLSGPSIEKARAGVYPKASITRDVSSERLRQFFVEVDGHYRVTKSVRDRCIFAQHNLLVDPPFSRVDLISCRNVLIYLESSSQQRILPTLHYALKPGGVLWLGTSETIGSYRDLFDVLDPKHKIFTKRPGPHPNPVHGPPGFPATGGRTSAGGRRDTPAPPDVRKEAERLLLGKYAPPGVLISADMDILQVWGDTGDYLSPAPGKASLSLLKMLRPGLLPSVRAAVVRALSVGHRTRHEGLRITGEGGIREVAIEVIPVTSASADGTCLILFEARVPSGAADLETTGAPPELPVSEPLDDEVARLTQELTSTREYLQAVIEQQEAAHEELQSSHEEIQSANEELQSVNEELETSKEEIQSSNEELSTVNDELNDRNRELGQTNDDLTNVLSSVEMPILILARDRRLRRFTVAAEKMLSLTPADLGRPIRDVTLGLAIPDLDARLADVIDSLQVVEREVQDAYGRWYLLRIRPYKTLENLIDGAIVMLVDITALRHAHEYAEGIVATVRAPLVVLDAELRVLRATAAFYDTFEVTPEMTEGRHLYELGNRQWALPQLRHLLEAILPRDRFVRDFEVTHEFETIGRRTMVLNARRLTGGDANIPMILLGIEDVTLRREQDATTRQRLAELAATDRAKDEFLAMLGHELRNPLNAVRNALQLVRHPAASGPAQHGWDVMDRQVTNLTRLVGDLLDVARIAQGQLQIEKTAIDVAVVVRYAVDAIRPSVTARGQELELVLPSAPVQVEADAIRLEQAFGNLLSNASKFTGQGGHIWITVEQPEVKDGADPGAVLVRVRDDGVGIEAHLLPRVFDLFTQADHSLARSQGGLGVGLTIVQRIVEAHGGQVEVRSSGPAQGSEFVVRLPACPGQPGETASETRPSRPLASEAVARRVLVVDDSVDSAQTMARLLRMDGHHVQVAYDGASALGAAATFAPDIVLLDIGLPGMDGYQVGRQLRHVPGMAEKLVVALTGYGQEQDRNRSREAGFDEHLTKPVDHDALRRLLQGLPHGV